MHKPTMLEQMRAKRPASPADRRKKEFQAYRDLIQVDRRFAVERKRLERCGRPSPCYSEFCYRCSNDSYHTDVKAASTSYYVDEDEMECEVVEASKPRSPKKKARHNFKMAFDGYGLSELRCLNVNLEIIPANQLTKTSLTNMKKRLRRALGQVFSGLPVSGTVEDSYHLVKDVPLGSLADETWRDGLLDDDLVVKLHFHGLAVGGDRTTPQLTMDMKRFYRGVNQVRVANVRSNKDAKGVEKLGVGGWAEYQVKRKLDHQAGDKADLLRPILIENRRVLNRNSQRLSMNLNSAKRESEIYHHVEQALMMLIDQRIYKDMDPDSCILFNDLHTSDVVDRDLNDIDSLYKSHPETMLSDLVHHGC